MAFSRHKMLVRTDAGGGQDIGVEREKPRAKWLDYAWLLFVVHTILFFGFVAWYLCKGTGYMPPIYRMPDRGFRWFVMLASQGGLMNPKFLSLVAYYWAPTFLLTAVIFNKMYYGTIKNKIDIIQGSAHWAKRDEIESAGLLKGVGVYVGGWQDPESSSEKVYPLRHNGPEHILAVAPTRSGKGVSLVVPTLLTWPHAAFVLDIKGENWVLSSGWRSRDVGPCFRFDPSDDSGNGATYNPLEEVHVGTPDETRDVQTIAQLLVDPDGKGLADHWAKTSFTLLQGAITHVIYKALRRSKHEHKQIILGLKDVRDELIRGSNVELAASWKTFPHMAEKQVNPMTHKVYGDDEFPYCHPLVRTVADDIAQKDIREASSIISTAVSFLGLWLDPVVARNTARSSFHLTDLVNGERPGNLYLVVPPSDLDRLRPLLRLMVSQMVFSLTKAMQENEGGGVKSQNKHRILLMLDEFPTLKKLDLVQQAMAYLGGYGAKVYIICQSMKQLTDIYGKDETISDNCHVNTAFAPNDEETAKVLSQRCGKTTVIVRSESDSNPTNVLNLLQKGNKSESHTQVARELMTPDECKRLPTAVKDAEGKMIKPASMLVFVAGIAPIKGVQTPYFWDPEQKVNYKIKPPTASAKGESVENKNKAIRDELEMSQEFRSKSPEEQERIVEEYLYGGSRGQSKVSVELNDDISATEIKPYDIDADLNDDLFGDGTEQAQTGNMDGADDIKVEFAGEDSDNNDFDGLDQKIGSNISNSTLSQIFSDAPLNTPASEEQQTETPESKPAPEVPAANESKVAAAQTQIPKMDILDMLNSINKINVGMDKPIVAAANSKPESQRGKLMDAEEPVTKEEMTAPVVETSLNTAIEVPEVSEDASLSSMLATAATDAQEESNEINIDYEEEDEVEN